MRPAPASRLRRAFAAAALPLAAAAGCGTDRERLDVPTLTLHLADTLVPPGGSIAGRVLATDESGVIYLAVQAKTPVASEDSLERRVRSDIGSASLGYDFGLRVSDRAQTGMRVIVTAVAIDNQNFTVEVVDTAFVVRAR